MKSFLVASRLLDTVCAFGFYTWRSFTLNSASVLRLNARFLERIDPQNVCTNPGSFLFSLLTHLKPVQTGSFPRSSVNVFEDMQMKPPSLFRFVFSLNCLYLILFSEHFLSATRISKLKRRWIDVECIIIFVFYMYIEANNTGISKSSMHILYCSIPSPPLQKNTSYRSYEACFIMKHACLTRIPTQLTLIYGNMCKYEYLYVDMSCRGTQDYNYYNSLFGEYEESVPVRLSGNSEDTTRQPADTPAGKSHSPAK